MLMPGGKGYSGFSSSSPDEKAGPRLAKGNKNTHAVMKDRLCGRKHEYLSNYLRVLNDL
jgi:hypothetical protein